MSIRDVLAAFAAAACAAGCSGGPGPTVEEARMPSLPPAPFVVRVVLSEAPEAGSPGALRVDATRLERAVREEFERSRACTWLDVVTPRLLDQTEAPDGPPPDVVVQVDWASPPTFAFARRSAWFVPNMLLWLCIGFPSFYVADRIYALEGEAALRVNVVTAVRDVREVYRYRLGEERALDVTDRGWTAQVLYTPPGFYEGPGAGRALEPAVDAWLARRLAAFVKTELEKLPSDVRIAIESPVNLETVAAGQGRVRATVASKAVLERLRVELDGRALLEKDALTMMRARRAGSPAEPLAYDIDLPFTAEKGPHLLRVTALRGTEGGSRTIRFVAAGGE